MVWKLQNTLHQIIEVEMKEGVFQVGETVKARC